MFSLITAIVSVVLVAVLAWATLYYGGSLWSDGEAQARAATVVNQGEQIVGAAKLYAINKGHPAAQLSDLVAEGYLSGIPVPPAALSKVAADFSMISSAYAQEAPSWVWNAETETLSLVRQVGEPRVCEEVNKLSFSVRGVRDEVDTRLRVQCYGSGAPYTVLWDARVATPPADLPKHPLCLATERINHIPAKCGTSLIEDANLSTPTQVSLDGYPNAMGPVDWIPDLPAGYWQPKEGKTCSVPYAYGAPLPPVEYTITVPAKSQLAMTFEELRGMVSDSYDASYAYKREYFTYVYIDGVQVQEFRPYEGATLLQEVYPVVLEAGVHVVRLEFATTIAVKIDSYGNPYYPAEAMPPLPTTEVCVSNLQMPLAVIPYEPPAGVLPEPGHVRLENAKCTLEQTPSGGELWYGRFWYEPVEEAWAALNYRFTVLSLTVVGTPETLDTFWGTLYARPKSISADIDMAYIDDFILLNLWDGYPLVRTSPTTMSILAPVTRNAVQELHLREVVCGSGIVASGAYEYCLSQLLSRINAPVARNFDFEMWVDSETTVDNTAACSLVTPSQVRPLSLVTRDGSSDGYLNSVTGELLSGYTTTPSCAAGQAWNESLGKCVCQPSANQVCAAPNAPLTNGITNTNSGATCTSTACKPLPWAPTL